MFYESVSSYFLDFLGKTTFNSFLKRAEFLRQTYIKEEEEKKKEEAGEDEFQAKMEGLKKEYHIFEVINFFVKNGKLGDEEYKVFKKMYDDDRRFSAKIHALFTIFDSKELVQKNEEKVLYHIKSSLKKFE